MNDKFLQVTHSGRTTCVIHTQHVMGRLWSIQDLLSPVPQVMGETPHSESFSFVFTEHVLMYHCSWLPSL